MEGRRGRRARKRNEEKESGRTAHSKESRERYSRCKKRGCRQKRKSATKKPVFSSWARSGRRTYGPQPPSENNLHAAPAPSIGDADDVDGRHLLLLLLLLLRLLRLLLLRLRGSCVVGSTGSGLSQVREERRTLGLWPVENNEREGACLGKNIAYRQTGRGTRRRGALRTTALRWRAWVCSQEGEKERKKERKKKKKKGTREEGAGYGAGRGGQGPSKPGGGFIDAAVRRFLNLPQPLFFSFSFFLFFSPLPFFSSPRRHLRSSTSVYRVDGSKNFHASIYGAWKIRYFPSFVRSFVRFPVFPVFSRGKRIRKGRELTNRRYSRGGG